MSVLLALGKLLATVFVCRRGASFFVSQIFCVTGFYGKQIPAFTVLSMIKMIDTQL